MTTGDSIAEVVANDLCIGCGLCEAATGGRVRMQPTTTGSLRPRPLDGFTADEERALLRACPGVVASPRPDPDQDHDPYPDRDPAATSATAADPVWGAHRWMGLAWAADPDVRFRAATGGVLTALASQALAGGRVGAVLHVGPDPDRPLRNRWVLSTTVDDVVANSGSRYAPTAPLAGLAAALDRSEPFAVVAKPCDLGAIDRWAAVDPRIDQWCPIRLTMVCGGQSRATKTLGLLDRLDVAADEVASIDYRGNGNPGPTRVVTTGGRHHEVTYLEMWEDESTWAVETRCKFCPDALGEAADVAAADAWPGGAPTGEDEGFNAIVIRTRAGWELVDEAVAAGRLVLGEPIDPRRFDELQPHQVRKKEALAARYRGLADAGVAPIAADGLRLDELGRRLTDDQAIGQRRGAADRIRAIRAAADDDRCRPGP